MMTTFSVAASVRRALGYPFGQDHGRDPRVEPPRLDVLLGTGGMAEVWRAVGPSGFVAVKRLLPHVLRNPSLVAAFEREGRLLGRIRHPNVIGILSAGRDADGPFIVLEYVEGVALRALCGTPVSPALALRVARDVLAGLEVVHSLKDEQGRSLGFLHRDLSPSNVLLGTGGDVKVADFGIARAISGTHATTGHDIKGTLAYMSPEQACGQPVDARSDLFAVGCLLYEMLSGAPVYSEADPRIALARARAAEIEGIGELCPDLPRDVVELVDQSLAAAPADRLPTAEAMRTEIERVADFTTGLASLGELSAWIRTASRPLPPPLPLSQRPVTSRTRRRRRFWMASLGAGAAAVLAAVATLGASTRSPPAVVAPLAPLPAVVALPEVHVPEEQPHAAPSAQAREKTAPRYGWLDIGSQPGFAYVTIDGARAGATPLFRRRVPAGRHRIRVFREGVGEKTIVVDVAAGERVTRVVRLQ